MDELLNWMVENKLARNRWNAEAIYRGLKLDGVDIQEAQVRCYVYRGQARTAGQPLKMPLRARSHPPDCLTDVHVDMEA